MAEFSIGPLTFTVPVTFGPSFLPVNKDEIQKGLANLETGMNWAGYVVPFLPFIGDWAGKLRIVVGSAEASIGLALAAIRYGQAYWESNEEQISERAMERVWENLDYAQHGFANIGRGCLEQVRIVNVLIGIFWDYSGQRMKYQVEKEIDLQNAQREVDGSRTPRFEVRV